MRYVDVSAATAIGLITVVVVAAWSPVPFEAASRQYLRQASMQDYLESIALKQGITWFQNISFDTLCGTLAGYSNSTLVVSAVVGARRCATPPAGAGLQASLTLIGVPPTVSLRAWQVAGP